MAYVNNATTPGYVEFQYYRSVSSHTESQQGDQVCVYKLDKNSGWSVTTRKASVKVAYNNGITGTYSNDVMTLKHANAAITAQATQGLYPIAIDAYGHITGYGSEVTSLPASDVSSWAKASTKPSYALSEITGAEDVQAIEALTGTSGILKKTAANTWTLDTTAYTTNTGTVTSITLKAGSGISLDTDNTAITTSGTRTITNSGVRSATINGNYLRVNTNGTNADLTIPYATSAESATKATQDASGNTITTYYQKKITSGTADPSGGSNGDIYFQYEV